MTTLYHYQGDSKFKPVNGGGVLTISGGSEPDPDPNPEPPLPPPPTSWQNAIDTKDIVQVALWYEANTGFDGINPEDPNDLPISEGDLTWVEGGIKSTHDGQVFEGLHSNHIRISHNNVTVRRCKIDNGALYGAYYNPTHGANITGTVVEFCTFIGPTSDTSPILFNPDETPERSALVRHCEMIGWDGGIKTRNWVELEYNYVHDQYHPPGVHSTSIIMRGSRARARRNLLTDGTSNVMGIYMKSSYGHAWDIRYEENIAGGSIEMPDGRVISPEASPSYHVQITAEGEYLDTARDFILANNYLYPGTQYGVIMSSIPWGEKGNYRWNNVWLESGSSAISDYPPPGD